MMSVRDICRGCASEDKGVRLSYSIGHGSIGWRELTLTLILICCSFSLLPADSYAEASFKRPITIDHTKVAYDGSLQMFFEMKNDPNIGLKISDTASGNDVYFTDINGTLLNFEKVSFSYT
ncbi:MAG TPA: hypothetical protein PKY45_14935, partial [Deltaproteobacteria bacterium]|nr:hypothetical protein [Deltaproteobacteria bacterium]